MQRSTVPVLQLSPAPVLQQSAKPELQLSPVHVLQQSTEPELQLSPDTFLQQFPVHVLQRSSVPVLQQPPVAVLQQPPVSRAPPAHLPVSQLIQPSQQPVPQLSDISADILPDLQLAVSCDPQPELLDHQSAIFVDTKPDLQLQPPTLYSNSLPVLHPALTLSHLVERNSVNLSWCVVDLQSSLAHLTCLLVDLHSGPTYISGVQSSSAYVTGLQVILQSGSARLVISTHLPCLLVTLWNSSAHMSCLLVAPRATPFICPVFQSWVPAPGSSI